MPKQGFNLKSRGLHGPLSFMLTDTTESLLSDGPHLSLPLSLPPKIFNGSLGYAGLWLASHEVRQIRPFHAKH